VSQERFDAGLQGKTDQPLRDFKSA